MYAYLSSFFYTPNLDTIIQGLKSPIESESDYAVQQLVIYDKNEEARKQMVEKGAIKPLSTLLFAVGTSDYTKENIVSILANLALCEKEAIKQIADTGGIPPLLALISGGTDNAKQYATVALMNILVDDENIKWIDESVVRALCVLLRSGKVETKRNVPGVLANIATDKEKRKLVLAQQPIPDLVKMLDDRYAHIKGQAAGALMNLADGDDAVKLQISKLGAVKPLVSLLTNGTTAGKVRAAKILFDLLSISEDVRKQMEEAGAREVLRDLLDNGTKKEKECAEPLLDLFDPSNAFMEPETEKDKGRKHKQSAEFPSFDATAYNTTTAPRDTSPKAIPSVSDTISAI